MPLAADQFVQAVVAAGLSSADEIQAICSSLPVEQRPQDGESLASLLVAQNKLTNFQAQELLSGTGTPLVLGDYVLLAKIGAGGMGQVFQAQHRHMKRLVAIKLLPAALTKDEAAVKRFQREVEAAAKLAHPNIVQAYDASVQRGVWYLVMEYVEGRDLSHLVAAQGPLPVAQVLDYLRQAARGLAYAHASGVVHRDIKPANLLLDKKGTIKILDMGLARFDDGLANQEGLTQSGQVMGTVDYMAPEQAFDTRSADARADIYSLGCTLYRLVTGQNLYDGETLVQKLMKHQSAPIPSLVGQASRLSPHKPEASARDSEVGGQSSEVSKELDAIFQKMVAKRSEDRYATMTEVEAALAGIGGQGTGNKGQETGVGRVHSDLQLPTSDLRSSHPSATGIAIGPASPAGELSPTVSLVGPQHSTDPVSERSIQIARSQSSVHTVAKPSPRWRNPLLLTLGSLGAIALVAFGIWMALRTDEDIAKTKIPGNGSAVVSNSGNPQSPTPNLKSGPAPSPAKDSFIADPAKAQKQTKSKIGNLPSTAAASGGNADAIDLLASVDPAALTSKMQWRQEAGHLIGTGEESDKADWLTFRFPTRFSGNYDLTIEFTQRGGFPLQFTLPLGDRAVCASVAPDGGSIFLIDDDKDPPETSKNKALRLRADFLHRFTAQVRHQGPEVTIKTALDGVRVGEFSGLRSRISLPHWVKPDLDQVKVGMHGSLSHLYLEFSSVTVNLAPEALPTSAVAPPPAKAPFDAAQAKAHQKAWAEHLAIRPENINSIGMKLALIPPGQFLMGRQPGEEAKFPRNGLYQEPAATRHKVTLTRPYVIGTTEVTQRQWREVVGSEPWSGKERGEIGDDYPATYTTKSGAEDFCRRLSEKEGVKYRLPTEAEWEFACRAGTETISFYGDNQLLQSEYAVKGTMQPVASKKPNPWGLFDLYGNLWEWVADGPAPHPSEAVIDPLVAPVDPMSIIRGSCFRSAIPAEFSSGARHTWPGSLGTDEKGFRVVCEVDEAAKALWKRNSE